MARFIDTLSVLVTGRSHVFCFVEGFGGDIHAIWPRQSSSFNEELLEKLGFSQRFEYRTLEPLGYVNLLFRTVVKSRGDDKATHMLSSNYLWQIIHVASRAVLGGPHCLHHRVRSGILPGVSYREGSRNGRPCGYRNLVGTSEPIHCRLIDIGNDDALIGKCHGHGPDESQVPGSDSVLRQIQKITKAGVDNKI